MTKRRRKPIISFIYHSMSISLSLNRRKYLITINYGWFLWLHVNTLMQTELDLFGEKILKNRITIRISHQRQNPWRMTIEVPTQEAISSSYLRNRRTIKDLWIKKNKRNDNFMEKFMKITWMNTWTNQNKYNKSKFIPRNWPMVITI